MKNKITVYRAGLKEWRITVSFGGLVLYDIMADSAYVKKGNALRRARVIAKQFKGKVDIEVLDRYKLSVFN